VKLVIESVPFDSARLATWLERQLVGERLGELIDELIAVRPPTAFDFDRWFAPLRDQILSEGLAGVPRPTLRLLFADPRTLRHLQRAVLLGGGRYWDQVPRKVGPRPQPKPAPPRPTAAAPPPPSPARRPPHPLPPPANAARPPSQEVVPLTVAPVTPPPVRSRARSTPPPLPPRRGVPLWAVLLIVLAAVAIAGGGAFAAWFAWQPPATPPTG
jgi:hypothetical protein